MKFSIRIQGEKIVSGNIVAADSGAPGVLSRGRMMSLENVFSCCLTSDDIAEISSSSGAEVVITAGSDKVFMARMSPEDRIVLESEGEVFDADSDSFLMLMSPVQRHEARSSIL